MIKIYHYSNRFSNTDFQFHQMTEDFGESVTDKSFFRPDISSARASLGTFTANSSGKVGVYDFNDGKDTGETFMTFLRNKSLDQTEIDAAYDRLKSYAEQLKQADIDKFMSDNEKADAQKLRENLGKFLNRDSVSDVVQDSTKSKQ